MCFKNLNHNPSKCREQVTAWWPTQLIYLYHNSSCTWGRLGDHSGRRGGKTVRTRGTRTCCQVSSPRNVREATPRKSHPHGSLNKTRTRTTQIDLLAHGRGKPYQASTLDKELRAGMLRAEEIVFPREEPLTWFSNSKKSAWDHTYKQHYVDYESCVYIFRCMCV